MKRDSSYTNTAINTQDLQLQKNFSSSSSSSSKPNNNNTMWFSSSSPPDEVDDEIFATLGYSLKSSDMFDVAQKIQHLDQAMGTVEHDDVSHLGGFETVLYNPSDLSSCLDTMSTGLNPDLTPTFDPANSIIDFGSDLTAIPGEAIYPPNKKPKTSPHLSQDSIEYPTRPAVLIDSQENGIRLVHTLMACAEAVQQENFAVAEALLKNIGFLAVSQAGAMRKVATYFAEALARRIYKLYPTPNPQDSAFTDLLQMNFYETCPYLKFAHFTANQAILEAFEGKSHVHVIDFSMNQGIQWPALLQALALRPGGPPVFRLTGIGPPSHDNQDHLQEIGWKLAQIAESINVEFEYKGFVANSLADLDSSMFDVREGETVAINSIFELHRLLSRVGAIEKVLGLVKDLKPEILTIVEQEANHNGNNFLNRFTESLHYYSTLFDSLESGGGGVVSEEDKLMSEVYLGQQICNVVACDGVDRVERHESLDRWRIRLGESGFEPVHLGSNAFKQASMLLALFAGGDGYMVEENNGCLMLGWHTRPLIATSAWKMS